MIYSLACEVLEEERHVIEEVLQEVSIEYIRPLESIYYFSISYNKDADLVIRKIFNMLENKLHPNARLIISHVVGAQRVELLPSNGERSSFYAFQKLFKTYS